MPISPAFALEQRTSAACLPGDVPVIDNETHGLVGTLKAAH